MEDLVTNADSGGLPWRIKDLVRVAEGIIATDPQLFALAEVGSNRRLNVYLIRDYAVRGFIPRPERIGRESRFGLAHLVHLLAVRVLLSSQKWSLRVIKAHLTTTSHEDLLNGLLNPVKVQVYAEYAEATGVVEDRAQANEGNNATTRASDRSSPPMGERAAARSRVHFELEPWCEMVIDANRLRLLTWAEVDRLTKTLQDRLKEYTPQVRRTRHVES